MTSISTYASRFLSLATNNNSNSEYDEDSDPLFRSHLDDQHPNDASLSSSDGLPSINPSNNNQPSKNPPGSNSLAGMSRYSSYGAYGGGNGGYSIYANQSASRKGGRMEASTRGGMIGMGESIREIDDDDDVDLWRNERRNLSSGRGRVGLDDSYDEDEITDDDRGKSGTRKGKGISTASTSSITSDGNGNGNVDPFLADPEDDHQRGSSSSRKHRSKSKSKSHLTESKLKIKEGKKSMKKGWLAHGDVESSVISEEGQSSRPNNNTVFDSVAESEAIDGETSISANEERGRSNYSVYEDDSGSETSRDDLMSNNKSNLRNKGKGRATSSHQEDATVSIALSPNQSRTGRGRGRARSSSTTSSISSSSDSSEDLNNVGAKSLLQLDPYSLPPIPSGDSWAPWPWYLFQLPEFIRNALDDRIWERNRERDEEWGQENRNRNGRRRGQEFDEEENGIKPPAWTEWNDRQAVVAFSIAILSVFVVGGAGGLGAKSTPPPTSSPSVPAPSSPYLSLFHSVPLLFLLTLLSLSAGAVQFLLLRALRTLPARIGARVLSGVLIALPITLALGWAWAFGGSFWDDEESRVGGGWSTTGLRIGSLVPLVLAIFFSQMLYSQRKSLSRSLSVLELSSRIISLHPSLLFLSFSMLGGFLLLSIPLLTIFARLFLNGHFAKLHSKERNGNIEWVWETDLLARWMAYVTFLTWIWIWSIGRGIMRVTISGVVSHWYYEKGGNFTSQAGLEPKIQTVEGEGEDGSNLSESVFPGMMGNSASEIGPSAPPGAWDPPKSRSQNPYELETSNSSISSIDLVRSNFLRATGTSLGTIIQSSFLLTLSYILLIISSVARRLARLLITPGTPAFLSPLLHFATLLAGLSAIVKGVSEYGLVYTGVTGENWTKSTKVAGVVTGRFGRKGALDGLIIHSLLSLSSLSLSFLTGIAGFLYAAHNLHTPSDAPLIGLVCGIIPWWVLRMCGDVIGNAADTLYLCHALDLALNDPQALNEASTSLDQSQVEGDQKRNGGNQKEVREAFGGQASGLPF